MLRRRTHKSLNVGIFTRNPRYKNGTNSSTSFVFPTLPYRALQSDRCLVITAFCNLFAPSHGDDLINHGDDLINNDDAAFNLPHSNSIGCSNTSSDSREVTSVRS